MPAKTRSAVKSRRKRPPPLTPSQQRVFDLAVRALRIGPVVNLWARNGTGRTTLLERLRRETGGILLTAADFLDAAKGRNPFSIEEVLYERILSSLRRSRTVLVDDWHVLTAMMEGCHSYPRSGYIETPATALAAYVDSAGKRLLVGTDGRLGDALGRRAIPLGMDHLTSEDYSALFRAFLGPASADRIDAAKVHRFAPKLTAHHLRGAGLWLQSAQPPSGIDADTLIEYLRRQRLTSNVELADVRNVDLRDLRGMDDVIAALEANVVLPFENDAVAQEFGLEPSKGILLAGPPGTGKTTIGRALAHRLRGKFFLLDGTVISGTARFYTDVQRIFAAARENAPSVIFIDDSDVIFESGTEHGLYRYLLTMLDGLEGEGGKAVCVVMTAMDVGNLPPALVRSGRISLWLETRLPDEVARQAILRDRLERVHEALRDADMPTLLGATTGFTGADLERMVRDAKTLLAYDRVQGRPTGGATAYLVRAAEEVRRNQERYARAETSARQSRPERPSWFSLPGMFGVGGDDDGDAPAQVE